MVGKRSQSVTIPCRGNQAFPSKLLRDNVGDCSNSIGEVDVPRPHKASLSHMQCRLLRSTQSACHAACQPQTQTMGALEPIESDIPARRQHCTGIPDSVLTILTTRTGERHGARRTPAPDAMQHIIHRDCSSSALSIVTRSTASNKHERQVCPWSKTLVNKPYRRKSDDCR